MIIREARGEVQVAYERLWPPAYFVLMELFIACESCQLLMIESGHLTVSRTRFTEVDQPTGGCDFWFWILGRILPQ